MTSENSVTNSIENTVVPVSALENQNSQEAVISDAELAQYIENIGMQYGNETQALMDSVDITGLTPEEVAQAKALSKIDENLMSLNAEAAQVLAEAKKKMASIDSVGNTVSPDAQPVSSFSMSVAEYEALVHNINELNYKRIKSVRSALNLEIEKLFLLQKKAEQFEELQDMSIELISKGVSVAQAA